jgi:DNA processing protein
MKQPKTEQENNIRHQDTNKTEPSPRMASDELMAEYKNTLQEKPYESRPTQLPEYGTPGLESEKPRPSSPYLPIYNSENDEKIYLIALTMTDNVGPRKSRALIQHFGSARAIFKASKQMLSKIPAVGEKIASAIHKNEILKAAERELHYSEKNGIQIISWNDAQFPKNLRQVEDSPLVLYVKGKIGETDRPHIAVVGTRKPSPYGKKIASEFAAYFAEKGIVVVSGLAFGIDMEAHIATMQAGGITYGILGHGLGQIYPREHSQKALEIVSTGGALITEFCSSTQPDAFNFPARNRIISGLCDAIVVVEATEKGGALITARSAFDQDREVFAVPGNLNAMTAVGCNRLIRDNIAKLACGPEDVVDSLQHLFRFRNQEPARLAKKPIHGQLSPREELVCDAMGEEPIDLDTISSRSEISGAELRSLILGLEFRKVLIQVPGNKYQMNFNR